MTPPALSTYRDLQSLGLSGEVLRRITIGADGRPNFAELSDAEFDDLLRVCRRVYPLAMQGGG
jgi:hypothetical protein